MKMRGIKIEVNIERRLGHEAEDADEALRKISGLISQAVSGRPYTVREPVRITDYWENGEGVWVGERGTSITLVADTGY